MGTRDTLGTCLGTNRIVYAAVWTDSIHIISSGDSGNVSDTTVQCEQGMYGSVGLDVGQGTGQETEH
jgi:hypothetical protein